jgi:hypothetical protein
MPVIMYERTAWSDYFTGTPTNYNSQTYETRQTPSGTSVHISNCLFRSISSTSQGGAVYCSGSATYFLVESTSFFSCKTSINQGAIYFYHSAGEGVLHSVCGYDCCTTNGNNYQFGHIRVNNAISSKNYVNYSSIVRCVNGNSSPHNILGLEYGKVCCPSVNISLNKCYYRSGISCWPSGDSSVTCSLTYSSFTDNHATGYTCIYINRAGATFEMKSCNIIRNSQGTGGTQRVFYINGNLNIYDSCIIENTATNTFYQYQSSYTITLSNCTIDKATCNRNLGTQNTVTKSFILGLKHMSTQNCHSEYDSAGHLTPIIQTQSSSAKQRLCYTFKYIFIQPQLTNTFASTFIFIFNFIHLGSSIYP